MKYISLAIIYTVCWTVPYIQVYFLSFSHNETLFVGVCRILISTQIKPFYQRYHRMWKFHCLVTVPNAPSLLPNAFQLGRKALCMQASFPSRLRQKILILTRLLTLTDYCYTCNNNIWTWHAYDSPADNMQYILLYSFTMLYAPCSSNQ